MFDSFIRCSFSVWGNWISYRCKVYLTF